MERMPFVSHLLVMGTRGRKPTLNKMREGVTILAMEDVELEGAKPDNSRNLRLHVLL